jgi:hypothetical protein
LSGFAILPYTHTIIFVVLPEFFQILLQNLLKLF